MSGLQPDPKGVRAFDLEGMGGREPPTTPNLPLRKKITEQTGGDSELEEEFNKRAKAERDAADRALGAEE